MKLKSFTLIEILIATLIFMLVAMIAATTFVMVRNTSDKTSDLAGANACSRQIESFVESMVRSSRYGYGKRIMGVDKSDLGASYVLKDLYQSETLQRFYGLAFFVENNKYRVVIKRDGENGYLTKDFSYSSANNIENNKVIDLSDAIPLNSNDCGTFTDKPVAFESKNLTKPFQVSVRPNTPQLATQTPSVSPSYFDSLSYLVGLNDIVYMKGVENQKQSIDRKSYEQVFVSSVNSLHGESYGIAYSTPTPTPTPLPTPAPPPFVCCPVGWPWRIWIGPCWPASVCNPQPTPTPVPTPTPTPTLAPAPSGGGGYYYPPPVYYAPPVYTPPYVPPPSDGFVGVPANGGSCGNGCFWFSM